MKPSFKKRIGTLFLIGGLLYIAVFYVVIRKYGKPLVEYNLSQLLGQPVEIGDMQVIPPIGFACYGIHIPGLQVRIAAIQLYGIFPDFWHKRLQVSRVIVQRAAASREDKFSSSALHPDARPRDTVAPPPSDDMRFEFKDWQIQVKQLIIGDSSFYWQPKNMNKGFLLEKTEALLLDIRVPLSRERINLRIRCQLTRAGSGVNQVPIFAQGWVAWPQRDLDVTVHLLGPKEDSLAPDPEAGRPGAKEVRVKWDSAKGLKDIFQMHAVAANNDLAVTGVFNVGGMLKVFTRQPQDGAGSLWEFLQMVRQQAGLNLEVHFRFDSKLDDVRVDRVEVWGGNEEAGNPVPDRQLTGAKKLP